MTHIGKVVDEFKYVLQSETDTKIIDNQVCFYHDMVDEEDDAYINEIALEELEMIDNYKLDEDNFANYVVKNVYAMKESKDFYTAKELLNSRMSYIMVPVIYEHNEEEYESSEEEDDEDEPRRKKQKL